MRKQSITAEGRKVRKWLKKPFITSEQLQNMPIAIGKDVIFHIEREGWERSMNMDSHIRANHGTPT